MHIATILLPDFMLIAFGVILARWTHWGPDFWAGLEKFVYFILFPAMLFYSTARLQLDWANLGTMMKIGMVCSLCGIALSWAGKWFIRAKPRYYESGMQTAFRFNTYLGLALASRFEDPMVLGLMAMVLSVNIPLCNVAAVYSLAQGKASLLPALLKNPMLVSTAAGLLYSMAGLPLPDVVAASLLRLGNAAIALGLLLVGTGLTLKGISGNKLLVTYLTTIKLMVLPCIAWLIGRWAGLPPQQLQVAVLFAGLPTASSCYILATRMDGNGPITAFLVSVSTIGSALTMTFWLAVAAQ